MILHIIGRLCIQAVESALIRKIIKILKSLVVDDCSNDDTQEVMQRYKKIIDSNIFAIVIIWEGLEIS